MTSPTAQDPDPAPPPYHERAFRLRHAECDARERLSLASALRILQETALDATETAGYGPRRYREMERMWVAILTECELLAPLTFDDRIVVRTWIDDFSRSMSCRRYEIRKDGAMAARARTNWLFLDTASGRPATIPAEMVAAFHPGGTRGSARRGAFPAGPPRPDGIRGTRRTIEWSGLDSAYHVNNAVWVEYLEDAAVKALVAGGHGIAGETVPRPVGLAVEYRQPAGYGDEVEFTAWTEPVPGGETVCWCAAVRDGDPQPLVRARIMYRTDGAVR